MTKITKCVRCGGNLISKGNLLYCDRCPMVRPKPKSWRRGIGNVKLFRAVLLNGGGKRGK